MGQDQNEFAVEYQYIASTDADERLAEAYDLILDLILSELAKQDQNGEPCSTPSA
jgi:hypothetical protein